MVQKKLSGFVAIFCKSQWLSLGNANLKQYMYMPVASIYM